MKRFDPHLQELADLYIEHYFQGLPTLKVYVSDEPNNEPADYVLAEGAIRVSDKLLKESNDGVKDAVKHALVHAWLEWKGLKHKATNIDGSHNKYFLEKAREVGCDVGPILKTQKQKTKYQSKRSGWFNKFSRSHRISISRYGIRELTIGVILPWGSAILFAFPLFGGQFGIGVLLFFLASILVGILMIVGQFIDLPELVFMFVIMPLLVFCSLFSVAFFFAWWTGTKW